MTALLDVRDLEVRYGRSPAVRDVSLSVEAGECVCVVGPNGAGKSTTLLAIAGALGWSSGSIEFDGRSLAQLSTEEVVGRGISLVPEGRRVFARMTVGENLRLATFIRRDRAAAAIDLERVLARFPILKTRFAMHAGALSGGEQQQLAIARALLTGPRLLLLDEPSLGLSPKMTDLVYATLKDLRGTGLTLLIVEQNVDRVLDIADRYYVLSGGVVRMSGLKDGLKDRGHLEKAYFGVARAP